MKVFNKPFLTMSIRDKLIINFILIFIVVGGVLTTILYLNAKQAILDRTTEQLTSVKFIKKKQIETFFKERMKDIDFLKRLMKNKSELVIHQDLSDYIFNNRFYTNIDILHFRNLEEAKKNQYKSVFNGQHTIITETKRFNSPDYELKLYSMIISKNDTSLIECKLDIGYINNIMLSYKADEGFGLSGETYIVGHDFLMRSQSRFVKNSVHKIKVKSLSTELAFKNKTGTIQTTDYRNIAVLSSFSKLNIIGLDWAIISEIDISEALIPANDIKTKLLIISIFLSLVIFSITYYISNRITKPLIKLNEATKSLERGDIVNLESIRSNDEIGELTDSFNKLTKTIKEKDAELSNERLKRFSMVVDAQEAERLRLSIELHDGLGQFFSGIKLKLESFNSSESLSSERIIEEVKHGLDNTINEIRRISNNLMPAGLQEFGIVLGLRNLCLQVSQMSSISINFTSNFEDEIKDKNKKLYIYRIVQEALNNIIKHSQAKVVEIGLIQSESIILSITDDGIGFEHSEALKKRGNGLYNMEERTLYLNGKISIESEIGKGTVIICNIPK